MAWDRPTRDEIVERLRKGTMAEKMLLLKPREKWHRSCKECGENIPDHQGAVEAQDDCSYVICFACANSFKDGGVALWWRDRKEDPNPFDFHFGGSSQVYPTGRRR